MGWMQPFLFWEFIQGAYLGLVPIPAFGLRRDRSRPASAFKIQLHLCSVRCRKVSQVQANEEN